MSGCVAGAGDHPLSEAQGCRVLPCEQEDGEGRGGAGRGLKRDSV